MNQLQNNNLTEKKENDILVLEMEKTFSENDVFLFVLKRNYVGLFQFIAFSLFCFMKKKGVDFFSIFIIIMQIWALILILKTYYIYKIEFYSTLRIISIYTNFPLLKIKAKQEFQVKDVKIGKTQNRLTKIDAIEIMINTNQIIKFSLLDYEYSLKKENVNNYIAIIKKLL